MGSTERPCLNDKLESDRGRLSTVHLRPPKACDVRPEIDHTHMNTQSHTMLCTPMRRKTIPSILLDTVNGMWLCKKI